MKFFFKLLAVAILLVAECRLVAESAPGIEGERNDESMSKPILESTGRVVVGFKRQKVLLREGKDSIEVAQIRAVEKSSIVATLAKVRDEGGYPEIKTEVVRESEGDGGFQVFEVGVGNEDPVIKALTEGDNKDLFSFVSKDYIVHAYEMVPNDPRLDEQYMVDMIDLKEAWSMNTGSPDITIGVCDTGVIPNHPDLHPDQMLEGYDAINGLWEYEDGANVVDGHGHGTHVTGIAAATGDNGEGIAGVGWNFKHRNGKCLSDSGSGTFAAVVDCMRKLCEKTDVKVLNLSLGPFTAEMGVVADECVEEHNTLVVQAAGNDSNEMARNPAQTNVIMVGSTNESDEKSYFSNYGPFVDVWAPGSNILSTMIDGDYVAWSGTSMACPVVAGLAALIMATAKESHGDYISLEDVRFILESTTTTDLDDGFNYGGQNGRVNAKDAVAVAFSGTLMPTTPPTTPFPSFSPTEFDCDGFLHFVHLFTDNYPEDNTWDIKDTEGTAVCSSYDSPPQGNTLYTFPCCIKEAGIYNFSLYDSWGDGICCEVGEGYVKLYDEESELVFEDIFTDGYVFSEEFQVGTPAPTSEPTASPTLTPSDVVVWMKISLLLPTSVSKKALTRYLDGTSFANIECTKKKGKQKHKCTLVAHDDALEALAALSMSSESMAYLEDTVIAVAAKKGYETSGLEMNRVEVKIEHGSFGSTCAVTA